MLESIFSGRWDAGFAEDKDGNCLLDQPFDVIEALIKFLLAKSLDVPLSKATQLVFRFQGSPSAKQQHCRDMVEY
jgi:hypothetical protein